MESGCIAWETAQLVRLHLTAQERAFQVAPRERLDIKAPVILLVPPAL